MKYYLIWHIHSVCTDFILLHPFQLSSFILNPPFKFFSKYCDQIFPSPILMSYSPDFVISMQKNLICKSIVQLSWFKLMTVFLSHHYLFKLPLFIVHQEYNFTRTRVIQSLISIFLLQWFPDINSSIDSSEK